MANTNLTELFTGIADSIRAKDGTSNPIAAINFADRINAIPAGSSFDMASLNYVEIAAPSAYSEYSTLPDLTPYVDDFSKIVAMYWCGDTRGTVYVYIRGLNGNKVTLFNDVYGIRTSQNPQFVSPNAQNFHFLNGNLSGLNICFRNTSTIFSTVFTNALVMLYEN